MARLEGNRLMLVKSRLVFVFFVAAHGRIGLAFHLVDCPGIRHWDVGIAAGES